MRHRRNQYRTNIRTLFLGLALLLASAAAGRAADWYVSPTGTPGGSGTIQSPWDIGSTLLGQQPVAPGDTVLLRGGTYRYPYQDVGQGFLVHLSGTAAAPVQVRPAPGEHVIIDGGLHIKWPAAYLWIWDLEITVSEPRPPTPIPTVPNYTNLNRPWGGLSASEGVGCKYIDLVIHDNCQGVTFWAPAKDSELNGCVIYDNGWQGTDRGHGHAIYTQNGDGVKTIADCIMTGGYGYTMHAYGPASTPIDNYLVQGNTVYNANTFLIGGDSPSHNITVLNNAFYNVGLEIGYTAPYNVNCDVENNILVNGGLEITNYQSVTQQNNLVLQPSDPRPPGERVLLRPSRYDPNRAELTIFDWDQQPLVNVDASSFLQPGDRYRLMDPRGLFARPVATGIWEGGPLAVPVQGEFAAFVLLREPVTDAPGDLTAAALPGGHVHLGWINNAPDPRGAVIQRSTDGVHFHHIARVDPGQHRFTDRWLKPSTTYYYRVRVRRPGHLTEASNIDGVTTLADPPVAPVQLKASPTSSGTITLSWIDRSRNEDVFYLERSTDAVNYTQIGAVGAGTTTYTDTGLPPGHYSYRIRGWNTGGYSPYSQIANAAL